MTITRLSNFLNQIKKQLDLSYSLSVRCYFLTRDRYTCLLPVDISTGQNHKLSILFFSKIMSLFFTYWLHIRILRNMNHSSWFRRRVRMICARHGWKLPRGMSQSGAGSWVQLSLTIQSTWGFPTGREGHQTHYPQSLELSFLLRQDLSHPVASSKFNIFSSKIWILTLLLNVNIEFEKFYPQPQNRHYFIVLLRFSFKLFISREGYFSFSMGPETKHLRELFTCMSRTVCEFTRVNL